MDMQVCIPVALCAIHNFIQWLDPEMFFTPEFQVECLEQMNAVDGDEDETDLGFLTDSPVGAAKRWREEEWCDRIVEIMWWDYCHESRQRGYM